MPQTVYWDCLCLYIYKESVWGFTHFTVRSWTILRTKMGLRKEQQNLESKLRRQKWRQILRTSGTCSPVPQEDAADSFTLLPSRQMIEAGQPVTGGLVFVLANHVLTELDCLPSCIMERMFFLYGQKWIFQQQLLAWECIMIKAVGPLIE